MRRLRCRRAGGPRPLRFEQGGARPTLAFQSTLFLQSVLFSHSRRMGQSRNLLNDLRQYRNPSDDVRDF